MQLRKSNDATDVFPLFVDWVSEVLKFFLVQIQFTGSFFVGRLGLGVKNPWVKDSREFFYPPKATEMSDSS